MPKLKKSSAAILTCFSAALMALGGCSTVKEYWQIYTKDLITTQREPTGYYEHTETKDVRNDLKIPAGLQDPIKDRTLEIPELPANAVDGPVGEKMDVRSPIAPLRSELGIRSQWSNGEAIVWFESGGAHGVYDESGAWELLGRTLKRMKIEPGKITDGAYELTTLAADFDEFGAPYSAADLGAKALRYSQIYRIRIGRGADGSLGIATQLIGSMTMLSSGHMMANVLDPIELQRFAMGFSNHFIHELENESRAKSQLPDQVSITIGRDSNNEECYVVDAPYEATWNSLRSMLPKYHWTIKEYSVTKGQIQLDVEEEDAAFYHKLGVDSFAIEDGKYIIRVGTEQGKSLITFYDKNDKPLASHLVNRIYSGFSQALIKELALYRESLLKNSR
ncbi:MAG: outer membrane protein assembly factor BamC [Succinivibrio sp.]|nr:outer membrane protein assembly factor BamC [Succinivibrio sp.]